MPFVKLDCGILRSTLWMDREAREVFITALLMAEPHEVTEPLEALKVDSLDSLGFTVPPGWYGIVQSAGIGIVVAAGLDRETGLNALRRLSEPDAESRSKDHEGRRLVRIDGGYLLLNYAKYRERDYTSAERSRRYRERKFSSSPRRGVTSHRDITQAEAEAEADTNPKSKSGVKSVTESRRDERRSDDFAPPDPDAGAPVGSGLDEQALHDAFVAVRLAYPRKSGRVNWMAAEHHWRRRLEDGATVEELLAGAERYARYVVATASHAYVLGPDKFFSEADQPWSQPWDVPELGSARRPGRKSFDEKLRDLQDSADSGTGEGTT